MKKIGLVAMSTMVARGILRNRVLRRKMILQLLLMLVLLIAAGTWLMDGWLEGSLVLFALFWGGVTVFSIMLGLLCIYDMLRAFKEIREEDRE